MKTTQHITTEAIYEGFAKVVKKWHQLETQPLKLGDGVRLYQSELKLLETIGENEGASVTELAKLHAITKGAVSQTLKKLESKQLAQKRVDPENSSRILVGLTPKGEEVFRINKAWHAEKDGGFKQYVDGLSEENLRFMNEFLTYLETYLETRHREST